MEMAGLKFYRPIVHLAPDDASTLIIFYPITEFIRDDALNENF